MWCERIVRNIGGLHSDAVNGKAVDIVLVEWNQCGRFLKSETRAGESVRMMLAVGETLRHGDVLWEDDRKLIVVQVRPCEVVLAHPEDVQRLAVLALELGNLHLPVQVLEGQIALVEDAAAMEVIAVMGIRWTREIRRFEPTPVMSRPTVDVAPQMRVVYRSRNQGEADLAVRSSVSNS